MFLNRDRYFINVKNNFYEFILLIFNIFLIIMNNNFLETKNFKFLINHVFNDIKQKTNQDISNNPKYIRIFKK